MPNELLTVKQVSYYLKSSYSFVLKAIKRGDLKAIKLGYKSYRISQEDLNNYIIDNEVV